MGERNPYRYNANKERYRYMVQAENYVMAKRQGHPPELFTRRAWDAMSKG